MRRILLSVGAQAGDFASRKKIARRFSEPVGFSLHRTRRFLFPKAAANLKKDLPCGKSFFGVSAGARTRTGSVGGSNGIQFHHGHIFRYFGHNFAFR